MNLNPSRRKTFFLNPNNYMGPGAHPASFVMGTGVISRKPSSRGVVKNECSRASAAPVDRNNFTPFHGSWFCVKSDGRCPRCKNAIRPSVNFETSTYRHRVGRTWYCCHYRIMICEILRPESLVCRVTERIPVFNWRPSARHLIIRGR